VSVRLSVTRVLCDKTKQCTADILIPHKRAITLVSWHQQWLVGDAPSVWNLRSKWPTPSKNADFDRFLLIHRLIVVPYNVQMLLRHSGEMT